MTQDKEEMFDNGILNFIDPLPGYSREEIVTLKEPNMVELNFWRSGERFKAIKMYTQRHEIKDKIELVTWYFLSMSLIANKILREQERVANSRNDSYDPLDPSNL